VYAATEGGLSISTDRGTTFTTRTTADGLGSNSVLGAYATVDTVYAATEGGLGISEATVNPGGAQTFEAESGRTITVASTATLTGDGMLTKTGTGTLLIDSANTYTGDTVVNDGALQLGANGSLRFVFGGSGTNNAISGTATTTINGQFDFDLSVASTNTNATWTIVANTLANSYGTNFLVTGFNGAGGFWTNTTNGVNYVFAQSTGVLSVQSTDAPVPYAAWVSYWQGVDPNFTNTAGTDNPDGDPFDNNEEYAFDGNPTVGTGTLLTSTMAGTDTVFNYVALTNTNAATYVVQSTTNLATGPWTNSAVTIFNSTNQSGISQANDYVRREFVVPGTANSFFRVQATIAP